MIAMWRPIRALLLADGAISSLVAGTSSAPRVHSDEIPQRAPESTTTIAGPTLVVTSWPMSAGQTSEGPSGFEAHQIQLDAYASTRDAADALAEACATALCPDPRIAYVHVRRFEGVDILAARETPSPGAPTYEKETRLYRRSLDFKIHAARAA